MDTTTFLRRLGLRTWRDFERRVCRDQSMLGGVSEVEDPDLYAKATGPLVPHHGAIKALKGDIKGRTYLQFLGYWLTRDVLMVAVTNKARGQSSLGERCDIWFFEKRNRRRTIFQPLAETSDEVQQAMTGLYYMFASG